MPETGTPYARYSRVTTRRGTLRPLNCPLDPELMVAEFSGELPPDVAQAVREHIATCETCGAHAANLRTPYNLLSALGAAPVPYVPDLRDKVRAQAVKDERWLRPLRALGSMSRFTLLAVALGAVLVGLVAFVLRGGLDSIGAFTSARTVNSVTHTIPAAPTGILLAETNKTLTLGTGFGQTWPVAEVVVADQQTSHVLRSLPASNAPLTTGNASTLPIDIVTDGHTVYELTSVQTGGRQAVVAITVANGATRFITTVSAPEGKTLPDGAVARSIALSADGQTIYLGLGSSDGKLFSARFLTIAASTGKVTGMLSPSMPASAPAPAPTGSLPASAFPSQTPKVDLTHLTFAEAAHGQIAVSPDGKWLFDLTSGVDSHGAQWVVVRRVNASSGLTAQALALPGPFHDEQLAVSHAAAAPQFYIVSGSPNAEVFVLDTTAAGPTLQGAIALGGPTVTNGATLSNVLSLSPTADGQRLYVTEDAASSDGVVTAHERWLVDTQGMGVINTDSELTAVGALLANGSTDSKARVIALVNGEIEVGASDFNAAWVAWMRTSDNSSFIRLVASEP